MDPRTFVFFSLILCYFSLVQSKTPNEVLDYELAADQKKPHNKCFVAWVQTSQKTDLDKEAFMAGFTPRDRRMYVGRATYGDSTVPGMITENEKGTIEFTSILNGEEFTLPKNFEYLKEEDPNCYCGWYPYDTVKLQPVVVRDKINNEEWLIGTAKVGTGYVIGKASKFSEVIYFIGENKKPDTRDIGFILQCSPKVEA